MDLKLLDILRCPACKGNLICHSDKSDKGVIIEGKLECNMCSLNYPIVRSIPRFVSMDNYAASFYNICCYFRTTGFRPFRNIVLGKKI